MILNWSGVIVGGVWLAILHEWKILVFGIALVFFGRTLLSFLMMFGIAIAAVGVKLRSVSWIFFGLALLVNIAVVTGWTVVIFDLIVNRPHGNVWPYILWAYAAVTIPWVNIATEEKGLDPKTKAFIWIAAVQFGSIAVMGSILLGDGYQSPFGMTIFFLPIAILGALLGGFMESGRKA